MSVATAISKVQFTANGMTTAFAYGFRADANSQVLVYLDGALKTIVTDYTLTTGGTGGTVTFVIAPTLNQIVTIVRSVDKTQPVNYETSFFNPLTHQSLIDTLAMRVQDVERAASRSLQFTDAENLSNPSIGLPSTRLGTLPFFDQTTGIFELITLTSLASLLSGGTTTFGWTFNAGPSPAFIQGPGGVQIQDNGGQLNLVANHANMGIALTTQAGGSVNLNIAGATGLQVDSSRNIFFPSYTTAGVLVNSVTTGQLTSVALGGNGTFFGVSGGIAGFYSPPGGGTVNAGTINQLAYYPASSNAVSSTSGLTWNGSFLTNSQTVNSAQQLLAVQNTNAGTSAAAQFAIQSLSSSFVFSYAGDNFSGSLITGSPTGESAAIYTSLNKPIVIGVNSTAVATFTSTGLNNVNIGATTAGTGSFSTLSFATQMNIAGRIVALDVSGDTRFYGGSGGFSIYDSSGSTLITHFATGAMVMNGTIKSSSGIDLALGTTAAGTALTITSATGAATFNGTVTGLQFILSGGPSFVAGSIYPNSINGFTIAGKTGSSFDFVLTTPGGSTVLSVPTGTLNLIVGGNLTTADVMLHRSSVALTAGGTANVPTLTSGPVTGNPTKWIPISDNGTTRYVPSW